MVNEYEIFARLMLAAVLGGTIGLERELRSRSAGLRTNALVCLGSALFMLVSQYMWFIYAGRTQVDPSRIAAQIITGIGFIGAGTIMKSRFTMKGLTTAASIWTVASVGMAVGAGLYAMSIITVLAAILILTLLEKLEHILPRDWYSNIRVVASDREKISEEIRGAVSDAGGEIKDVCVEFEKESDEMQFNVIARFKGKPANEEVVKRIAAVEGIKKVKCE